MKREITNFILTIVLALILSMFLPWWAIMVASFVSGAIVSLKKGSSFIVPFSAIALFWMIYAWSLSAPNDFILAEKVAVLLQLKGNVPLLIIITGVLGGIAAGISGVLGNQVSAVFFNREE